MWPQFLFVSYRCIMLLLILSQNSELLRAERIATRIFELDAGETSTYVVLGNIYDALGLHDKAQTLRQDMKNKNLVKIPGKSWTVDPQGKMHTFYAGAQFHPMMKEIEAKWQQLSELLSYQPNLRWVLQNESMEDKKIRLCKHSEKLALCFALVAHPPGTTIFILFLCCETEVSCFDHIQILLKIYVCVEIVMQPLL